MSGSDTYSWIGGNAGAWDTATNWEDLTAGTVAAIPPGIGNAVTIADITTLSGTGSAASLTISADDTLLGNINTGGLTLAGSAGSLSVVDGGILQAGSVSLGSNFYGNILSVDATSVFGVGSAGTASTGALTVDPGSTISGQGQIIGQLIDNGLIVGSDVSLGNFGSPANLSGGGTIEVPASGDIFVNDPVAAAGLTFQLDGTATLTIETPVAAGNTIDLVGSANTIDVSLGMPSVDATITGFDTSDIVLISDNLDGVIYSWDSLSYADGTLTLDGDHLGSPGTYTLDLAGTYASDAFAFTQGTFPEGVILNSGTMSNPGTTASCFAAGTRIATPSGDVAVEDLCAGDRVTTVSGEEVPVKWTGQRRIDCRRHPEPHQVWPVRILAGAFDDGTPHRDLWLSPDHAVSANDILIPIKRLINGTTIAQVPVDEVTYYHVELPRHDLLLAEGAAAETYLDVGDRSNFANGGGLVEMHPDFTRDQACEAKWEAAGCAPLRIEGEAFDRFAAHLQSRAVSLGQGYAEQRRPVSRCPAGTDLTGLLDPVWYLVSNPDVAAAGVDAAVHYVNWGMDEGRLPCDAVRLLRALGLVDPGSLVFTMGDVIDACVDPVAHFCDFGWRERRRPNLYFDTDWYIDAHDVPADVNPLLHYVLLGEALGMAPSRHFDPKWYRDHYLSGLRDSPLAHYLAHRRTGRFSPLPTFDVAGYVRTHATTLRPDRDPYAHYLATGGSVATQAVVAGAFARASLPARRDAGLRAVG